MSSLATFGAVFQAKILLNCHLTQALEEVMFAFLPGHAGAVEHLGLVFHADCNRAMSKQFYSRFRLTDFPEPLLHLRDPNFEIEGRSVGRCRGYRLNDLQCKISCPTDRPTVDSC